jgi:protocatechuate 3,4-dioxygenase alpha subunit
MSAPTASQTIGPFFAVCLTPDDATAAIAGADLLTGGGDGDAIVITGRVLDGAGEPVADAMVEIWQANAAGRYAHPQDDRDDLPLTPGFTGFGRTRTDGEGGYRFQTMKPGRVPGAGNVLQAPHVAIIVMARGMTTHAVTRAYFADEAEANAEDPVLGLIDAARRKTLIAATASAVDGIPIFRFDIHLQGAAETVFFDI